MVVESELLYTVFLAIFLGLFVTGNAVSDLLSQILSLIQVRLTVCCASYLSLNLHLRLSLPS